VYDNYSTVHVQVFIRHVQVFIRHVSAIIVLWLPVGWMINVHVLDGFRCGYAITGSLWISLFLLCHQKELVSAT